MSILGPQHINSVKQKDNTVPEHLDFQFLRERGLEHISKFSGRIWTDHNSHDPGITILEALCYAILDLGYRTQLPIEDLLALDNDGIEDNFFTPAQILTCNPLTIIDYRKLLMEIEGVKNAWLEILNEVNAGGFPTTVNGLYEVYLELEDWVETDGQQTQASITSAVKQSLSAHRNLCEDIEEICVLQKQNIHICAEVELLPGANADHVYAEIMRNLRDFIAPTARFYSLQAMLEKGKRIEDIYAGRPYLLNPDREQDNHSFYQSYGFLDTEEVEKIPRRRELHISDLYTVIHQVEGVRTVKDLCVLPDPDTNIAHCDNHFGEDTETCTEAWRFRLLPNHIPSLSIEDTKIILFNTGGNIPVNEQAIKNELTNYRKARKQDNRLDLSVPTGSYREDLDEYISIQYDFPRVYGIGDVGLPETASLLRKTQAKQLQGFLLFFDQLLADYLKQLSNLRQLFSREQESKRSLAHRHSYFSASLTEQIAPGVQELIRLHAGKQAGINEGIAFAIPVWRTELEKKICEIEERFNKTLIIDHFNDCLNDSIPNQVQIEQVEYSHRTERDALVLQLIRDFVEGTYQVAIHLDQTGYYFILYPGSSPEVAMLSGIHFDSRKEALAGANLAAFLGAWEQNLSKLNLQETAPRYSVTLSYRDIDFQTFLQDLTEDRQAYMERRELFLHHLLNRFSEQFSDYAAVMFGTNLKDEDARLERSLEDKSAFLSQYDDLSRNRGKGFDYGESSWNTDNVSGLEKRVSHLAGYSDGKRKSLCNIEVIPQEQQFLIRLQDWQGKILLEADKPMPSARIAEAKKQELISLLKDKPVSQLDFSPQKARFSVGLSMGNINFVFPNVEELTTPELAQQKIDYIHSLISREIKADNVEVSTYHYIQELLGSDRETILDQQGIGEEMIYEDEAAAVQAESNFVKAINKLKKGQGIDKPISLRKLPNSSSYIDLKAIPKRIVPCPLTWKWKAWLGKGKQYEENPDLFFSHEAALADFLERRDHSDYLIQKGVASCWEIPGAQKLKLRASRYFAETAKINTDWLLAKEFGTVSSNYHIKQEGSQSHKIELHTTEGELLAATSVDSATEKKAKEAIEEFVSIFQKRRVPPKKAKISKSWTFEIQQEQASQSLIGYSRFASKESALNHYLQVITSGSKTKNYLRDGGTPLQPEYIYVLRNDKGTLLAEPSEPFEQEKDRESAIQAAIKGIRKIRPIVIVEAQPQTYTFQLDLDQGKIPLTCQEEFRSRNAAQKSFLETLPCLLDKDYEREKQEESNTILIPSSGPAIAVPKESYTKDTIGQIADLLQQETYQLRIRKEAHKWRFYHYWESPEGKYEKIFQSREEFSTPREAEKAYQVWLTNPQDYSLQQGAKKTILLQAEGSKKPDLIQMPSSSADQAALQRYLDHYSQEIPVSVQEMDTYGEYQYQLIKRDNPHAYHRSWLKEIPSKDVPEVKEKDCPNDPSEPETTFNNSGESWVDRQIDPILLEHYYSTAEEACIEKDNLCKSTFDNNCWLDICVPVPGIKELPTGVGGLCKYHFVVRGSMEGELDEETDLLISIVGYDTKELAIQAYQEQLWHIIEWASSLENYGKRICLEECFEQKVDSCGRIGEYTVAISPEFMPESPQQKRIETLYQYFLSFPIRYVSAEKNFYVHLYNYSDLLSDVQTDPEKIPVPDWTSWLCYESYEEAWLAFQQLLNLLQNPSNCRVVCRKGTYRIELYEALMISCRSYTSEEEAWGRSQSTDLSYDDLVVRSGPTKGDFPCEESSTDCKGYGAELFLKAAQCEQALIPTSSKDNNEYGFQAVNDCYQVAVHPCWYETEKEAEAAWEWVMASIEKGEEVEGGYMYDKDHENNLVFEWEGETFCIKILPKAELSESKEGEEMNVSPCGCGEEDMSPFECPWLLKIYGKIGENVLDKDKDEAARAKTKEIIDSLTLDDPNRYQVKIREQSICGPYSFELVDACCILAKNPVGFDSASMRDEAMKRAEACLFTEGMHLVEHVLLRPEIVKGTQICTLNPCNDDDCQLLWVDDPAELDPCVLEENPKINYVPLEDPYSFWGTLVLPAWLKRFEQAETRNLFEHIIRKESPAHIAMNILWLSPREMCEFETCYRYWLAWKEAACTSDDQAIGFAEWIDCTDLNRQASYCGTDLNGQCELIQCLKGLKADPFCQEDMQTQETCTCHDDRAQSGIGTASRFNILHCEEQQWETLDQKQEVKSRELKPAKAPEPTAKPSNEAYKQRMQSRIAKLKKLKNRLKDSLIYDRALFFLQHDAPFPEYRSLINEVVKEADTFSGKDNPHAKVVYYASAHLLDKSIEKAERGEEVFSQQDIESSLKKLKDKQLNVRSLTNSWSPKALTGLFSEVIIRRFADSFELKI